MMKPDSAIDVVAQPHGSHPTTPDAYSAEAERRHVNEALSQLREWGYGPERYDVEQTFRRLPESVQRRSNAWQALVRVWVESR